MLNFFEENLMKKVINTIKNIVVWTVAAIAVFMMIFTIISTYSFNKPGGGRDVFGFKFYVVLSDSMKEQFPAGSLIVTKTVDYSTLKEGDIINFISLSTEDMGATNTITHMIRERTVTARGEPAFVTYGTTTGKNDEALVTYELINGKYTGHLPGVGYFFQFLKTPQGYITCIFVPFMLLIIYQGINSIQLFRRYKQEQLAAIQTERDQIEEERRQSAEMMKELQALKEQLAQKDATETASEDKASAIDLDSTESSAAVETAEAKPAEETSSDTEL